MHTWIQTTDIYRRHEIQLFILTAFVLVNILLERSREAAWTLAMLSIEGPILRHGGGSDMLLHWTVPTSENGGVTYLTRNGRALITFNNVFLIEKSTYLFTLKSKIHVQMLDLTPRSLLCKWVPMKHPRSVKTFCQHVKLYNLWCAGTNV